MEKQKILLFGYWENNLGDDLFLKIFSDRYPDKQLFILTKKKYKSVYSSSNIKAVAYDSFFYRVANKIIKLFNLPDMFYTFFAKKVDSAVCLGGSLFMEKGQWVQQIDNLNYVVKHCEKTFVIGSNFGPYYSKRFFDLYHEMFSKMKGICFREKTSYNLFSNLTNVRFAPDVVLNLKYQKATQLRKKLGNYYIISVINLEIRDELRPLKKSYERKIAEIASNIIDHGSKVILMSFCNEEGDLLTANTIRSLLKNKVENIDVYSHKDTGESLDIIANSKGIVATRLHAMILAWVFNKPVFPIAYSEKMTNIIKDYSFDNEYTKINVIDKLNAEDVYRFLQKKPNIPSYIYDNAEMHFSDVDYLSEKPTLLN
ncbi:polysaccharide pyruvyl transferase family protein [Bacillus sp. V33-4]|uniref:polysaccharide pyruvyl transferase family protein n=1 Tax=Bacillus sp. V33-4 TaxID=2054169 RepID=UPI000C76AB55|nr:polysaccharide pyruvyl transferase family protein [Bacillus sp. V33-4]PLR85411.1 hypothetical protein CVD23_08520 [Bacillus sp. V33-4]